MEFEYDEEKNWLNKRLHGVSLEDAQALWLGLHVIVPAREVSGEKRMGIVGRIHGEIFVAIFTRRADVIRLISFHRADRKWERHYEEKTEN